MNRNTGMSAGQIIGTMNGQQVVGLDIAKHVFQLHTVNMGMRIGQPAKRATPDQRHYCSRTIFFVG